jgi:hypothetical protein
MSLTTALGAKPIRGSVASQSSAYCAATMAVSLHSSRIACAVAELPSRSENDRRRIDRLKWTMQGVCPVADAERSGRQPSRMDHNKGPGKVITKS